MARKDLLPPSERGWLVETLLNVVSEPEAIVGAVRVCGHGLFLVGRAVFHLLTCHF